MAHVFLQNVVHYACTCGFLKPISKLYFCRHCIQLRCEYCLCHEIDSHFCPKCAENIPSSEARLKKNRCLSCYDCPCCQHQLSIRVSSSGQRTSSTEGSSTPRKVYYLACLFCRWTSRDVGISDQASACGGWPERENVHANRLAAIQDKYKNMMLVEKQEKLDKEKKKHPQRGKYMTLTDKTGLTAAIVRKRVGLPERGTPVYRNGKDVTPAVAQEEVETLNPEIFTKALNLSEVTTLEKRLLQPEWQSENINHLFPIHKHLIVKRSLRCRTCEHNVSKPEYNPNSIKYKIQHFAFYHVPEVRFVTVELLKAGKESELIIKLFNPTQYETTVNLSELIFEDIDENPQELEETAENTSDKKLPVSIYVHSPLTRQPSITVKPRPIGHKINCDIHLPEASIILPRRDDTAEYDDSGEVHHFQDDPKFIIWRKSNKVGLKLKVTPSSDLHNGDEVIVGFTLKHIYVNTITTAENKEPQKCEHNIKVFLTLGKIVGSD